MSRNKSQVVELIKASLKTGTVSHARHTDRLAYSIMTSVACDARDEDEDGRIVELWGEVRGQPWIIILHRA